MRLPRRLLSLALPAALLVGFALPAAADDAPRVRDVDVQAAHTRARDASDVAAAAVDRAKREKPGSPESAQAWDDARKAVGAAQESLLAARTLWNTAKAQKSIGEEMGRSILHSLADRLRRLAEVQRDVPPAPLPAPEASTPEQQRAAFDELRAMAAELNGELQGFQRDFGGKPAGAMERTREAVAALEAQIERARRDPAARPGMPALLEAAKAFRERNRLERRALVATLEEIRHLELTLPKPKPKARGGLAGRLGDVADQIESSRVTEDRRTLADLQRRAAGLVSSRLTLP